ncbi:MAG: cation:dicarboxylate symporter family transporter [Acidiferrobacterales bacterium]
MRMGLATQVLLGMLLGVVAGVFFGDLMAFLKVVGEAFIMLLQITVIPYITVALIVGLGRLSYAEAKRLALSGGSVLLVLWAIGLTLVFLAPLAYPNWPSASFFSSSLIEEPISVDFLNLYIPANPFYSLANAIVPAIVVFSILFGLALIGVDNKSAILEPLSAIAEALMRATGFVASLAPIGVFAITASAAGTMAIEDLGRLQVYLVIDILFALILSFWVLPGLVTSVTPLRYREIMKSLRGPLITAFATGSILIVLPLLARQSKELLGGMAQPDRLDKKERSLVDILIPTFFTFPNLGLVMSLAFALFAGWYIGSSISVSEYPTLGIAGFASLFGGPVLAIPFLLDLMKLPSDLFHLYLTVDVLSSRFGTLLAAMHLTVIALIGACAMHGVARPRLMPLLRFAGVSVGLVVGTLFGLKAFYTYIVVAPYTKDKALAGLQLIRLPHDAKVFLEPPPAKADKPRTFDQIQESGVVRICYGPRSYPNAFINAHGNLVGFDVEMAHRLARQLDLKLELLPLPRAEDVIGIINSGYCDVAMVQFPVIPGVAWQLNLTVPFKKATAAFIVPDYLRGDFATWAQVRERGEVRIGVYAFDYVQNLMREQVPDAKFVPMQNAEDQRKIIISGLADVDGIVNSAEEAAAWTILYPFYSVVIPRPVKSFQVSYALPRGSPITLEVVNAWLSLAKENGTIDHLYDYWVQGKIDWRQPPRWSVIRDVLHWVD